MISSSRPARAAIVETIPLGMAELQPVPGVEATADALVRLVNAAESTIDLTALYWSLRPEADDEDFGGWSIHELEDFGAGRGLELFDALWAAAARDVHLRIVESPGFGDRNGGPGPAPPPSDSEVLRTAHPENVEVRLVQVDAWFGTGIMHQKLWVFDGRSVYVGSANNDWRSLTQVKELGIVVEDAPTVAEDATRYFETWWAFAELTPSGDDTVVVFDPAALIRRRVPAWSELVPAERRRTNPLNQPDLAGRHGWSTPLSVRLGDDDGDLVLSGAPAEICAGERAFDGDLLVATILDARSTVCVNVMDFAPVSIYRPNDLEPRDLPASPVWWPALFDALLEAVSDRGVQARLLVSEWTHTSPYVRPFLHALESATRRAAGQLEIRRFRVPGWLATGPKTHADGGHEVLFPGHTRVNHVKYVVTDRRVNVGTSNMTWDYFNATAGTSVNASHESLVVALQTAFDRDWHARYASDISIPDSSIHPLPREQRDEGQS